MSQIWEAIAHHDLRALIEAVGLVGVWGIIFAESGLLVGFFLPGDSLIFTAGFLASPGVGFFNIWHLIIGSWIAAIVGDNVGYEFGSRVGRKLFLREESLFFKRDNLIKAEEFYEKHGGKAIVLARFMPIIRTFAPIVAGIGHMDHLRFTFYNFLGGTLWVWGIGFAGYFLGSLIPGVDRYLLPIVAGIILLSITPPLIHLYKENKLTLREKLLRQIKRIRYYIAPIREDD